MIKFKHILFSALIASSITTLQSCTTDDDSSITEPTRYTANDITTYEELFVVFWKTMDQRYNYFYEQKRKDGMDWDNVYEKYLPKFKALKTFGRATDNDREIEEDFIKANEYFAEIIDPIIDQHFNVKISLPRSNNNVISTITYYGGMLTGERSNTYPFASKYAHMRTKISNPFLSNNFALGGYLNSNPDIYYFSFSQFTLTDNLALNLSEKYLSPDEGNGLMLTVDKIDKSAELAQITNATTRKAIRDLAVSILNKWNEFPASKEVQTFNSELTKFHQTEIVSTEFTTAAQTALTASNRLVAYSSSATYGNLLTTETLPFVNWFASNMNTHATWAYRLPVFQTAASSIITKAPFYTQFLNPLQKGAIKKIIIDLRSNGGGAVVDARFFSDRFVTKENIFAYQRIKEGNGRFNYTPWVEAKTKPHKFGIPADIPIVLLTDRGSASMSEITTLMLKSQGNHVISVGDYSAGATAGLGTPDDFNGGTRDVIGGKITFYMPLLAMKDAKGEVIEGIGVKPDIFVTPPTNAELTNMQNSPATFVDRVLNEAVKYLSTK